MNGQFPPAPTPTLPAFRRLGLLRTALRPDPEWKRLYAALLASFLLHAAVMVMPYLGGSSTASQVAVRGAQKPAPARILTVRLLLDSGAASSAPGNAAAADAPAPPRPDEEARPAPERSLGIDVLPLAAPGFYTADQLTKRPQPIAAPSLEVPEGAPAFGSGKVVLKLLINELGRVVSADVEQSDVPEAVSRAAAANFARLRFLPGEINGRPVGSLLKFEVTYEEGPREDNAQNVGTPPP